jgi:hypothetical protein
MGVSVVGCGEGTAPTNAEPKPAAKPAPSSASDKAGKAKKDPREDMGLKELRDARGKKADQP